MWIQSGKWVAGVMALVLCAASAQATPISVGSGANTAYLAFNWADSGGVNYAAEYLVAFDGSITGYSLANLADAADDALALTWGEFDLGGGKVSHYLNIASYDTGGTNYVGDGGTYDFGTAPENYWHYYVDLENTGTWGYASSGADDTAIGDGSRNGWVFGSASFPVPEPASLALMALGAVGMLRRCR